VQIFTTLAKKIKRSARVFIEKLPERATLVAKAMISATLPQLQYL
jgi:hypothetical protein